MQTTPGRNLTGQSFSYKLSSNYMPQERTKGGADKTDRLLGAIDQITNFIKTEPENNLILAGEWPSGSTTRHLMLVTVDMDASAPLEAGASELLIKTRRMTQVGENSATRRYGLPVAQEDQPLRIPGSWITSQEPDVIRARDFTSVTSRSEGYTRVFLMGSEMIDKWVLNTVYFKEGSGRIPRRSQHQLWDAHRIRTEERIARAEAHGTPDLEAERHLTQLLINEPADLQPKDPMLAAIYRRMLNSLGMTWTNEQGLQIVRDLSRDILGQIQDLHLQLQKSTYPAARQRTQARLSEVLGIATVVGMHEKSGLTEEIEVGGRIVGSDLYLRSLARAIVRQPK